MRERCQEIAAELRAEPPPLAAPRRSRRAIAFLEWLDRRQLHLPRLSRVRLRVARGTAAVACAADRDRPRHAARRRRARSSSGLRNLGTLPPDGPRIRSASRDLLRVNQGEPRASTVHKPVPMDSVGVKSYDSRGPGDRRAPLRRPLHLRRLQPQPASRSRCCAARSRQVIDRAGFPPD